MAGEWVKIRPSLLTSPKVNGIAKILESNPAVTPYMTIGLSGSMNEIVTRNVMRNVTLSLLITIWGNANEHSSDGVFKNCDLTYIDDVTGLPGFGMAMASVGWAEYDEDNDSLILPNFSEYNTCGKDRAAEQNAERQRRYREKQRLLRNASSNVTEDVTSNDREEKRREENKQAKACMSFSSIIDYLNEKTGKEFKPVESNLKFIKARVGEGHSLDDLKAVIDRKVLEWSGSKMEQYLRPSTLFNAEKFNQYVGELNQPFRGDLDAGDSKTSSRHERHSDFMQRSREDLEQEFSGEVVQSTEAPPG